MKVLPFKIPKTSTSSVRVQIDHQPYFYDILHQHPETQITLIISGTGTLFQGEYIGDFRPGDVFVIGANVPHVMKSDLRFYEETETRCHSISIFFDKNSFGNAFFDLPELSEVRKFLHQSIRGIRLLGTTKEVVQKQILAVPHQHGLTSIISLLGILENMVSTDNMEYLSKEFAPYVINENEGIRLNDIFQFTMQEYHRPIQLKEVAGLANMTVSAFCRYFKLRTRKTYITFLNEVRITQACKLLLNEDLTIAQICGQSGFSNLSHFNRIFKTINEVTPKSFRKTRALYV